MGIKDSESLGGRLWKDYLFWVPAGECSVYFYVIKFLFILNILIYLFLIFYLFIFNILIYLF